MGRKWAVGVAVCALLTISRAAWGDGVELNGVSPRSISRGGTNQGFADNAGIIFDNPAAMVNIDGCSMVDIGIDTVIISDHFQDATRNNYSTTGTPLPQLGLIRKTDDGVFAYGLGIFTPAGFSQQFKMLGPFPFDDSLHKYESWACLVKILPAVACRVTDELSIGATLGVGVSYGQFEGPYFLQGAGPFTGIPTLIKTHGWGADLVWSVGMQYELTDTTTLGATYQSSAPFTLGGSTRVTVPGIGTSQYDSNLHVEWPQSVAAGVRQQLGCCRVIAADVVWFDWASAFDQVVLGLHGANNPFFPPTLVDHFPLDWRDSVSLRLGYEQQIGSGVTFRLGYIYHPDPIPNDTLTPWIQGFLEDALTVGFGWKWGDWDVDLGYVHMFAPREHVANSKFAPDFVGSTQDAMADAIVVDFIKKF